MRMIRVFFQVVLQKCCIEQRRLKLIIAKHGLSIILALSRFCKEEQGQRLTTLETSKIRVWAVLRCLRQNLV